MTAVRDSSQLPPVPIYASMASYASGVLVAQSIACRMMVTIVREPVALTATMRGAAPIAMPPPPSNGEWSTMLTVPDAMHAARMR